ncbi:MAG: phosphodiester glycosidase family protein [Eubacteriales bacterium]
MIIKYILNMIVIAELVLKPVPIQYTKEEMQINNKEQVIHTLTINMKASEIELKNSLSFDKVYGFETTSSMSKRFDAIAAVNGIFYDHYGQHIGGLVTDGEWLSFSNIITPTVGINEEKDVFIDNIETIEKVKIKEEELYINGINRVAYYKEWILYTPEYGNDTRITRHSINYLIKDNKIKDVVFTNEPVPIINYDYVLSQVISGVDMVEENEKVGKKVSFSTKTSPSYNIVEGFQSGGWIVKDGENISKSKEDFLGYTNYSSPRTLFGVTKDDKVIIKVIDGRQPGYSIGVSGYEAAEIMLDAGSYNAVYLDGGASSTMVVQNEVINRPSYKGERKVAHSLLFFLNPVKEILNELH